MKFFLEPLVHFLVLAALLFVLEHVFSSTQKEQIIVDQQTAAFLIKQREDLELRKLTPQERQKTIASYVEDEILYREAYKRGLDKGDTRMRRNMIRKMRGLLIGDVREPTDKELRTYFESNREEFLYPATVTLDHVFYSDPVRLPQDLLERLQAGADHRDFGEYRLSMGTSMPGVTQKMLAGTFGANMARGILAIEDDQWHGPFESIQGIHFVRITDRTPAVRPGFEEVKSYIEAQWAMVESRKAIEQEVERIRGDYEVVIEADSETAE